MKNLISILLVILLFSSCASSKSHNDYSTFYKKYKHNKEVVNFGVPTGLLALFLNNDEDKELKQFLKNVDHCRFFIAEDPTQALVTTLNEYLPNTLYNDVMVIRNGKDKITFKARESDHVITEIIMIVEEGHSFVVMNIEGEFTLKEVKEFVKTVNVEKVVGTKSDA